MADATIFMIENGEFGLAPVDKAAVGYLDAWQAPGGKEADEVTLADYDTGSVTWSCQVTSGALNSTPDTTTSDTPATFCQAATSVPTPAQTAFELAVSFLQDPDVVNGLNRFTFQHDTDEAYFYLGLNSGDPPRAIGRVRIQAGTIGGDARTTLTADLTLPCARKPDVEFGGPGGSIIIKGDGTVVTPTAAAEGESAQGEGGETTTTEPAPEPATAAA